jgi:hypothetical protein
MHYQQPICFWAGVHSAQPVEKVRLTTMKDAASRTALRTMQTSKIQQLMQAYASFTCRWCGAAALIIDRQQPDS